MRVKKRKKKIGSKANHVGFRNGNMFCFHCGRSQAIPNLIEAAVLSAIAEAFEKNHTTCPKTWKQPEPDMTLSKEGRAWWWLKEGEQGISSRGMLRLLYVPWQNEFNRLQKIGSFAPPRYPDDFRRCYLLLKAVPELKENFPLLRQVNAPVWANIIDNWDKLCAMLEEGLMTGQPNGVYEFMKSLGC